MDEEEREERGEKWQDEEGGRGARSRIKKKTIT